VWRVRRVRRVRDPRAAPIAQLAPSQCARECVARSTITSLHRRHRCRARARRVVARRRVDVRESARIAKNFHARWFEMCY
jgi:hypothetical protein